MRLAILAFALAGCATMAPHGIPNFAIVDGGVYRGGEPTTAGWAYLKSLGVRRAIQLDYASERPPVLVPDGIDVEVRSMPPADADDLFRGPTVDNIIDASTSIATGSVPVYVHCLHGQDRTGVVIAAYLYGFRGWTKAKALADALHHGLHWELVGLMRAWEAIP